MSSNKQFACSVGCKAPTLDTSFPFRDHLYPRVNQTSESGIDGLPYSFDDFWPTLLNSLNVFSEVVEFDDLSNHAESMEFLVVPYRWDDVTILTADVSNVFFLTIQ